MTTTTDRVFVLLLACGCPCSLVHAPDPGKAMQILYGFGQFATLAPPRHARIQELDSCAARDAVVTQIRAAPGRRFACRSRQHQARL